ncbi:uncharacterized protein BDZ83DRAFT_758752 [Colletotrichum acutatum]|uniref:Uncharacterized protein n=1 Tax=Glomerella acutata TaxID=27357 RepID=A0AAD8UAX1_GLOAC|nr:uncharacterized protein BDZ83DRAFT_758752 [Colletotrichum acutatum]KAK1704527.1 hypothetical protein BDZ83DRAFT_758752 [Colletotrichum acutatum]
MSVKTNILVYGADCFSLKNLKPRVDHHGHAWFIPGLTPADRLGKNALSGQADSAYLGLLGARMGFDAPELQGPEKRLRHVLSLALDKEIKLPLVTVLLEARVALKVILDHLLPMAGVGLPEDLHKNRASGARMGWLFTRVGPWTIRTNNLC